jgi:hypothetical protein
VQRLALRASHFAKLLRLAQDSDCLVRNPLAESRESHEAARTLDQSDSEQRLELAKAGGERRLRDKARFCGPSEMAMAAQRNQILELFQAREVHGHLIEKSNQSARYNPAHRLRPARSAKRSAASPTTTAM